MFIYVYEHVLKYAFAHNIYTYRGLTIEVLDETRGMETIGYFCISPQVFCVRACVCARVCMISTCMHIPCLLVRNRPGQSNKIVGTKSICRKH